MQGEQEYFFSFYPLQLFLSLTKQVLRHNHSMKFLLKNDEIVTIEILISLPWWSLVGMFIEFSPVEERKRERKKEMKIDNWTKLRFAIYLDFP